jgi:hypothetical protein
MHFVSVPPARLLLLGGIDIDDCLYEVRTYFIDSSNAEGGCGILSNWPTTLPEFNQAGSYWVFLNKCITGVLFIITV